MNYTTEILTNIDVKSDTSYFATIYKTAAGILKIYYSNKGIFQAEFVDNEDEPEEKIVAVKQKIKTSELVLNGTDFQILVWKKLLSIPTGKTISYQQLAIAIGKPKAWRAVANAVANNKIAYFVPCHRVIRKNGDMGGYKWGPEKKRALLEGEHA